MTNSLQIAPSSEAGLAVALNSLEAAIYAAAERNLEADLAGSPAPVFLTQLERTAILEIEALKLTNGIDLAALMIRGRRLRTIREQNLTMFHPEHYGTIAEMAAAQGLSSTELSYTDTLCNVVFPYIESVGLSVAQLWHDIGKSKFFELSPVLAAVITGQLPGRGATRESVLAMLHEEVGEDVQPSDTNTVDINEAVRSNTVGSILNLGADLPVREMRRRLRPNGTPDINGIVIHDGDRYFGVFEMDEDQRTMFVRLTDRHVTSSLIEGSVEIQPQVGIIRRMLGA